MRVFRLFLIAAMSTGALLVFAPTADAASSTQACATLQTLSDNLSDVGVANDPKNFDDVQDAYNDLGDAYTDAAKTAPKQVKSALKTIGHAYSTIGDEGFTGLQELASKKYSKALKKYSKFMFASCSGSS